MTRKRMMDDCETRDYEHGKSDVATHVDSMIEMAVAEGMDMKAFRKAFKKEFSPYIAVMGKKGPSRFEMKFNYLKTFKYRGLKIKVFTDDAGQQNYFYLNGERIGCGAYNLDWEGYIEYEVDHFLDDIYQFSDLGMKYCGAWLVYRNHEHTEISLRYRGEELRVFHPGRDGTFDIEAIKAECTKALDNLFSSREFQDYESRRKASGNLYFNEMLDEVGNEIKGMLGDIE